MNHSDEKEKIKNPWNSTKNSPETSLNNLNNKNSYKNINKNINNNNNNLNKNINKLNLLTNETTSEDPWLINEGTWEKKILRKLSTNSLSNRQESVLWDISIPITVY